MGEDCPNVDFARLAFLDCGLKVLLGGEGLVSDVDFVTRGWFDREGEFTMG